MKRYFSLLLIICFIFVGCTSSKYIYDANEQIGFSNGNIYQGGTIASDNSNLYFTLLSEDGLFKSDLNGNNKTKIFDGNAKWINVIGDTIYFIGMNDDYYPADNISSIKTDGTAYKVLKQFKNQDNILSDLYAAGNYLYYENYNSTSTIDSIRMMDINGKNDKEIVPNGELKYYYQGNILYRNNNDNKTLHILSLSNNQDFQVTANQADYVNVKDQTIYYFQQGGTLNKAYGQWTGYYNIETVIKNGGYMANISGDNVYYEDNNNYTIHQYNLSSEVDKLLFQSNDSNVTIESIQVINDNIYLYVFENNQHNIYRIDNNGNKSLFDSVPLVS